MTRFLFLAQDFNVNNKTYLELVESLRKYSLDEKCEMGLDFGVGFQMTTPYVSLGHLGGEYICEQC